MSASETIKGKIWEDGGAQLMARVVGQSAANITQASLTSIACKIFDLDGATPTTAVDTSTLTVSSVVYDTLQTDARWTTDTTGYNFRHAPAYTIFTTGGHRYRIEYKFTPVSGDPFFVVFQLQSQEVLTS